MIDGCLFFLQEHQNFVCDDEKLGPLVLSVKQEIERSEGFDSQGFIRVILRYSIRSEMLTSSISTPVCFENDT